jgi:hypothetical protein
MITIPLRLPLLALLAATACTAHSASESLASPDGRIVVSVDDSAGLSYRVDFDDRPALADSRLGLDFAGARVRGFASSAARSQPRSEVSALCDTSAFKAGS